MVRTARTDDNASDTTSIPGEERTNRLFTVPNVLCLIRLLGSPILVGLAFAGHDRAFLGLFLFLAMTDWVDGKLAIWLNQRSVFGARLDSWADATLYAALLLGGCWLQWDELVRDVWWIGSALGSYAITTCAGFWKFGRWPSYHTRAAKTSWFIVTVGAICLLGEWSVWPFRVAMAAVTLTNLEATCITYLLTSWRADVPSVYHALKLERASSVS